MKKWIALGVVTVLALTLILSCPSTEDHREAMKEILKESLNQSDNLLISMLGGYVLDAVADEVVSGKNFFFASAGYIEYEGEKQLASIGLLGHVFVLFDQEDIDKLLEEL